MNQLLNLGLWQYCCFGGMMGGTALDVGGIDEQGNDITNDLSFMVLDAHAHTRIPNPWMAVRLHANTPEFKIKVFM